MTGSIPDDVLVQIFEADREAEWIEFKANNADPNEIGRNISAISNSATLHQKPKGLIVWGIDDQTQRVIGTTFDPFRAKIRNEELESWYRITCSHRLTSKSIK